MRSKGCRVAVIGGGITGWLVSRDLVRNGIPVTVYDADPCSSYSSTRNQGWLHGGAFYVATNDHVNVAKACFAGSQWFKRHVPHAIQSATPCYYLFETEQKRDEFVSKCAALSIFAQSVSLTSIMAQEPFIQAPIVGNSPFAAQVQDCPIDTNAALKFIVDEAVNAGTTFRQLSDWSKLQIETENDLWKVGLPDEPAISYDALVLACGPYIKTLLGEINSITSLVPSPPPLKVTKVPVLVLHDAVARSMMAVPAEPEAPQLVPFTSPLGNGVTICLHRVDVDTTNPSDDVMIDQVLELHSINLDRWFKGIPNLASHHPNGNGLECHFYLCHKISLDTGATLTRRHFVRRFAPSSTSPKNLLAVYPGKFTTAPIAARNCAKHVLQLLNGHRKVKLSAGVGPQAVADRPYHTYPQHRHYWLKVDAQNQLTFEP